jgi:hypothetical protein
MRNLSHPLIFNEVKLRFNDSKVIIFSNSFVQRATLSFRLASNIKIML